MKTTRFSIWRTESILCLNLVKGKKSFSNIVFREDSTKQQEKSFKR